MIRAAATKLAGLLVAWAGLQTAYLLALLGAAQRSRAKTRAPAPEAQLPTLVVLVPAHDESELIERCVRSLLAARYPQGRREIVVIADNCTDDTAALARAAGATVWERRDDANRGKGQALAWALDRVRVELSAADAIVMVDADCVSSEDLLLELGTSVVEGADAAQADYGVSNPEESTSSALRYAGYALMNGVRTAGKEGLGLSCGLMGSGMVFPMRTLEQVPWDAFSVTEDREYHLRLVDQGGRARFVGGAWVRSPMPTTQRQGEVQQMRWETGNVTLARRWIPRLLRRGGRDPLHAAVELTVQPLSVLVALSGAGLALSALARSRRGAAAGLAVLGGQVAYVFGGLAFSRAPSAVYSALLRAPALVARRLLQMARILSGSGASEWQRTERQEAG